MGVDHLAHAMGEAGSEPLAGEYFCRLGVVSLGLDHVPASRRGLTIALMGCRALSTDPFGRRRESSGSWKVPERIE